MAKVLKTLNHAFKRKGWRREDNSKKPLMSNMISQFSQPVDGHSGIDPVINTQVSTDKEKMVLSIPEEDIHSHELKDAADPVKQCLKLNGTTPKRTEDFGHCSQNWSGEYLDTMDMSDEKNFPTLPPEGAKEFQLQTGIYLNDTMSLMCSKVNVLVPVLEDSGLLNYLIGSYNHHLFANLNLLMDRSSSMIEAFFLLNWVKQKYFCQDLKGCPNIQDDVLRVSDPLLLTDWFEKSKQKVLTLIQEYISTTLQNILLYEAQGVHDYRDEEAFIKIQLDVIQCLNATIQETKRISEVLKNAVQRVCCDELHSFVKRYVNAEKKWLKLQKPNETNSLRFFRIIYTCRELRSYALNIMDFNNNTDLSTLLMLENMESHILSSILQWLKTLAEDHFKKYFKNEDIHKFKLIDKIQNIFAPLSEKEQGKEIKQLILNAAYQSITRAYLQCLMQRKYRKLDTRWGDIEKRVIQDAGLIHNTFTLLDANINLHYPQNGSDDKPKMLLLEFIEILGCSDLNALKLICSNLYKNFPKESEEYLPDLLNWKGGLSRRLIKEVLNVSKEVCQNGGCTRPHPLLYWSCCL